MSTPRTHVVAAVAAALALSASLVGLSVAAAGEGDERNASADPPTIPVGGATEVTPDTEADYCDVPLVDAAMPAGVPSPVTLVWNVELASGGPDELSGSQGTAVDGSWAVTLDTDPLPADEDYLAPGDYVFTGLCSDLRAAGGASTAGAFQPNIYVVPFTVTGVAEPEFDVTSDIAAGPPGTTVQLTGIDCVPGLGSFVAVKLMPAGPVPAFDNTDETLEVYEVFEGGFTGPFVIPTGTAAGTYQLVAWCLGEGGQPLDGTEAQVLGFTVTAAAVPVVDAPDFTG